MRGREISKNYFSQPLKSVEARASPASPVPTPLKMLIYSILMHYIFRKLENRLSHEVKLTQGLQFAIKDENVSTH